MEERKLSVEIAKAIGTPIDPNLPVNPLISGIADTEAVPAGEDCYTFVADTEVDTVLTISSGVIAEVKVIPNSTASLSFTYFDSGLNYVLSKDIMETKDSSKMARTKVRLVRGLDKKELKSVIDLGLAATTITPLVQATEEDVLDVIIRMKQAIENYGDNYVLLVGSSVKALIDTYDKDNAKTGLNSYRIGINETLAGMGIKVIKVSGKIKTDSSDVPLLAVSTALLVALDSTLQIGKPFVSARRIIAPELAAGMGIEVTDAQRGLFVANTPVIVAGANTLGYAIYGFENICIALINPYAVVKCATIV